MKSPNKNNSLNSFVLQLKNGERITFEVLFKVYHDKLLHIAKGYLGSIEDAEGVVQNVFLKIWERKENLDQIVNINNYLFTMTKNACFDQIKHNKVKNSFSESYYQEKNDIQYHFMMDIAASALLEKELDIRIQEAIKALPNKCRHVFEKSRLEGMKHSEIAEVLNISKRTVDNHISNALKLMRLHLKEFLTLFL
ncbi:RNA polymerase sigma-70 factor [Formosa undariae]|uniref:RNA polymerase sigma-70 factor n=1 Tax=Formosa undariae TaxID=1325436 RepID=A0ABV5F138_9FLAO